MNGKWRSFLLIGLTLLLVIPILSCAPAALPLLTLLGCRIVDVEDAISSYQNEAAPILEEWKDVINEWENKASDPERSPYRAHDAEDCYDQMQTVISAWDTLNPPDEVKEYHDWMRQAMDYEREAFRIMAQYYRLDEHADPEDFDRLHNLAVELWILKDKALDEAVDAFPAEQ